MPWQSDRRHYPHRRFSLAATAHRQLLPCIISLKKYSRYLLFPFPCGSEVLLLACLSGCVFLCLFASISREPHVQFSPNLMCMLPMAVARSSSRGVATCYVIRVLWITPYSNLHIMARKYATRKRHILELIHQGQHLSGGGVWYLRLRLLPCCNCNACKCCPILTNLVKVILRSWGTQEVVHFLTSPNNCTTWQNRKYWNRPFPLK